MRLQYFLLVAAVTLLASAAAVAARTGSAQTMVSTTTSTDLVPPVRLLAGAEVNHGNAKRFLRRSNEDQEERANLGWLTKWIKGIKEGHAQRAQLSRNHKDLKKFYREGILTVENLKFMKDKGMISSKKVTEYTEKLQKAKKLKAQ